MTKFIQANLNHCRVAQDLLIQYMVEQKVDVALVSDPHRIDSSGSWHADCGQGRAAIYIPGGKVTIGNVIRDSEFVAVRINGIQVYSCYASPNRPHAQYERFIGRLETSVRSISPDTPVLVAGDFNARSAAWGDWIDNPRGDELSAMFESLDLVIANTGSTPTFNRGAGSIVDVTAMSGTLSRRIEKWRVMDEVFNNSDHHYIQFAMDSARDRDQPSRHEGFVGWNTAGGIDTDSLHCGLLAAVWQEGLQGIRDVELAAHRLEEIITSACNFAIPRRRAARHGKPPVHWWNNEISLLRSTCVKAKRSNTRMVARITRLRTRAAAGFDNNRAEEELARTNNAYREAKRQLKNAIMRSKKACWTKLIKSVDSDPFGKPYKTVMRKLRGRPATATMEPDMLKTIISTLFPAYQLRQDRTTEQSANWEPFSITEIDDAIARFKGRNKAPGPDGITSKILWAVHGCDPSLLLNMYNLCLQNGTFPEQWKRSRIVLLRKGNKPEDVPSYRPLCLLNDIGKVLEFLLAQRLETHIKTRGGACTQSVRVQKWTINR